MLKVVNPVFVRSVNGYKSYTDFWRLVELSGFPIIDRAKVDLDADHFYIWAEMNAELMIALQGRPRERCRARTVLWSIERPDQRASATIDARAWWKTGLEEILELVDEIWVSDRNILAMDPRSIWVAFGGDARLRIPFTEPDTRYDVAHFGQLTPRREKVIAELAHRGIRVSPNAVWGDERAQILSGAKVFLGIERLEGIHISTPLRWVVGAAYGIAMVQEEHEDPAPLVPGESILMAPIEKLADRVEEALAQDLAAVERAAWETFCHHYTFRGQVDKAVQRSLLGANKFFD